VSYDRHLSRGGVALTVRGLLTTLVVAAGFTLGLVPAAQATTNIAPNPGFEQGPPCSPVTVVCGWAGLTGTISQDPIHHLGSFSMKIVGTGPNVEATTINGSCVTIDPGNHPASFWYRTSDTTSNQMALSANWFSNTTCSIANFSSDIVRTFSPISDGAWHQVTGTLTAPATTGSATLGIFEGCSCTNTTALTVYFDDVDIEAETVAVTMKSITAARVPRGVVVRWRTGTEVATLGFHVFRERSGKRVRIDRRLIPAKGSVGGARYSFHDRRAPRGKLRYRLQAVGRDGSLTWYGPTRVIR
jgi:hypothetical protein